MKLLLTIATFSLSLNTFALTLDGVQAANLRKVLIASGAENEIRVDASFVSVSNISCSQEGGFVLLPYNCKFIDNNSGRQVELQGPKAEYLNTALIQSNIKPMISSFGELSKKYIAAKSIQCFSTMMPNIPSCEIK